MESIKHSDGGVSELGGGDEAQHAGVYQAFRWWGVGTLFGLSLRLGKSLSSIPMVGCRNAIS